MIEILGKTAQLELFDLESNLVPPSISAQGFPIAKDSLYSLLAGQQALVNENTKTTWYLFDDKQKLRAGPVATRDKLLRARRSRRPARRASSRRGGRSSACRRRRSSFKCGIGEVVCPGVDAVNPTQNYFYLDPLRPHERGPERRSCPR